MSDLAIDRVRSFNRTWTEVLGLLDQGLLETEHTLAEARVIFEFDQRDSWERLELRQRLGMDASFLTRVLNRLEHQGLITSTASDVDGRALNLSLTEAGRAAADDLADRSNEQIGGLLAPLSPEQQRGVVESMTCITQMVRPDVADRSVVFRGLEPGDMGWVIQRHGAIYAQEYQWNVEFEALVAGIVSEYQTNLKAGRENAWIAEVGGARAACVFCCERDADTAQLRILLVEPWARGLGLGSRLVEKCMEFARDAGYSKMTLWTNDILTAARHIYQAAGFELVDEEAHHSFGHDLVGQNWEVSLG